MPIMLPLSARPALIRHMLPILPIPFGAFVIVALGLAFFPLSALAAERTPESRHVLTIAGSELRLDGAPIKLQGLRTSAALMSDATTLDLINHLDLFRSYGVNAISVYVMGSRFTDVKGYRPDATLDPVYAARLARIARAEPTRLEWEKQAGPFFGNQIGELVLDGRSARFVLSVTELGQPDLRQVLDMPLTHA